jgi:hypothetical protein
MRKIINDIFKRKFKVRVKYSFDRYYKVEYCYYRLFPTWCSLSYFEYKEYWILESDCRWFYYHFTINDANDFALKFKSIVDIHSHYLIQGSLENKFKQDKVNRKPYDSKIIIN